MFFEAHTVWDNLKNENRPIVLYGMGDACEKILKNLDDIGVTPADIFASDEFVRGHIFHGYKVMKYSEICEKYDDCVILVCFATFLPDVMQRLRDISKRYTLLAPYISMFGDELCTNEFIAENREKIENAYSLLSDGQSRLVFSNVINYMISGKIQYLFDCETDRNEVFENIIKLGQEEKYLDLGAYNGDTIMEFLNVTNNRYKSIIAFEPDRKNFKKLTAFTLNNNFENCSCLPFAVWKDRGEISFACKGGRMSRYDESGETVICESIDNVLEGDSITYIKMDVEGAEREAILGGQNTLVRFYPKLAVSAYHKISDIFELILLLHDVAPKYKIFLRHHPYIPAFETNIYAVRLD